MEKFKVRFITINAIVYMLIATLFMAYPDLRISKYGGIDISGALLVVMIVTLVSIIYSFLFMSDSDFEEKEKEVKVNELSKDISK